MYSLNLPAGELPQRFRLHVSDEALVGQAGDPSAPYWVAVADFDAGRWDWFGPFSVHEADIYLPPGTQAGFLSPLRNVYCSVLGYVPAQGSAASPAIEDGLLATDGIGGNTAPEAFLTATPEKGPPGTAVSLDASLSSDPDGSIVDYQWDLDGDGRYGEIGQEAAAGGQSTVQLTLGQPGNWFAAVRVIDDDGAAAAFAVELTSTGWSSMVLVNGGTQPAYALGLCEIDGSPAIAYSLGQQMRYAIASSQLGALATDWLHSTVWTEQPSFVVQDAAFADVNGYPAIAWGQLAEPRDFLYAHSTSARGTADTDWQLVTVDDYAGKVGGACDLAVVGGFPAVAYKEFTTTGLRYSIADDQYGAGNWTMIFVDNHEDSGNLPSLMEHAGRPWLLHTRISESTVGSSLAMMRSDSATGGTPGDWSALFVFNDPLVPYYTGNIARIGSSIGFTYAAELQLNTQYRIEYRYLDPDSQVWLGASPGTFFLTGHVPLLIGDGPGIGVLYLGSNEVLYYLRNAEKDGSGSWDTEVIDTIKYDAFTPFSPMEIAEINGHICVLVTEDGLYRIKYAVRYD